MSARRGRVFMGLIYAPIYVRRDAASGALMHAAHWFILYDSGAFELDASLFSRSHAGNRKPRRSEFEPSSHDFDSCELRQVPRSSLPLSPALCSMIWNAKDPKPCDLIPRCYGQRSPELWAACSLVSTQS